MPDIVKYEVKSAVTDPLALLTDQVAALETEVQSQDLKDKVSVIENDLSAHSSLVSSITTDALPGLLTSTAW